MSYEDTEYFKLKSNCKGKGPETSCLTWSKNSKVAIKLVHTEQEQ